MQRPVARIKRATGEINVPIFCGGVVVCPGDIIVADADGVIVVPLSDAAAVADAAEILRRQDAEKASAALAGTVDRAWNDRLIVQKGIEKLGCMWNA